MYDVGHSPVMQGPSAVVVVAAAAVVPGAPEAE